MAIGEPTELDLFSRELHRLTRLFDRTNSKHVARHGDGLERATYLLLVRLAWDGPRRLRTLAENVHSDTSTVSRQVAALVKLGLVERRADPSDGRACVLAATEAGEAKVEAKRQARNHSLGQLFAEWSEHDQHTLRELLNRFNNDFERFYLGESK